MSSRCPFLRELSVCFCEIAPSKKLVPSDSISEQNQRCTSPDFVNCPLIRERAGDEPLDGDTCPFIHTTEVNYCSAASDTKFIPANDDRSSRCNTSAHAYCDIFLQFGGRKRDTLRRRTRIDANDDPNEEAPMDFPTGLVFSDNHMWMDVGDDGGIHIGADSFLARAFGPAEALRFVCGKGLKKPTVILTVNSIDLPIVFPRRIQITGLNKTLEDHPERLHEDPYGSGWLFEHLPSHNGGESFSPPAFGLMGEEKARSWMSKEIERMAAFLEDLANPNGQSPPLAADGGLFQRGVARQLSCPDLITMYNLFFSPVERWRK